MAHDTPQRNYEQVDADRQQMLAHLRGMERLLQLPISEDAKATVQAQIGRHKQRLAKMDSVVQAYDDLEADGYPEMIVEPSDVVQQEIAEVLRANQEHVKNAMSQVSEELSHVQELFGGRRRGRRAAHEEPKADETGTDAKEAKA